MNLEISIRDELMEAAELSHSIYTKVMDECPSVGRGLLGTAMAYVILSKSSPVQIDLDHLIEVLRAAHEIVSRAEEDGDGHVLQ